MKDRIEKTFNGASVVGSTKVAFRSWYALVGSIVAGVSLFNIATALLSLELSQFVRHVIDAYIRIFHLPIDVIFSYFGISLPRMTKDLIILWVVNAAATGRAVQAFAFIRNGIPVERTLAMKLGDAIYFLRRISYLLSLRGAKMPAEDFVTNQPAIVVWMLVPLVWVFYVYQIFRIPVRAIALTESMKFDYTLDARTVYLAQVAVSIGVLFLISAMNAYSLGIPE